MAAFAQSTVYVIFTDFTEILPNLHYSSMVAITAETILLPKAAPSIRINAISNSWIITVDKKVADASASLQSITTAGTNSRDGKPISSATIEWRQRAFKHIFMADSWN